MNESSPPWEPPPAGTQTERLLREAIDGGVGEDPPNDWRPQGAAS